MIDKTTDKLLEALKNSSSTDEFLIQHEEEFINISISDMLCEKAKEKHLSKASIIHKAEISEIYGYQLFSGVRTPSRDTLICMCIGMDMDIDEIQAFLKAAGFATLYPKNRRDSIILIGIKNHLTLCDINESLYANNEMNFNQFK